MWRPRGAISISVDTGKTSAGAAKNELNLRNACDDFGERKNALMLRNGCGDQEGGEAKTQKCIVRNGFDVQKERKHEGIETTQRLRRPEGTKNMNALKLRNGGPKRGQEKTLNLRYGCGDQGS